MSNYTYASVLEAQSDGKPPNDNIEEGQKIVKAGKHETDQIEYMTEDGDIDVVEYESVTIYESDSQMSEREAQEFAKDQWFAEVDDE
jgi:hypothetical protein